MFKNLTFSFYSKSALILIAQLVKIQTQESVFMSTSCSLLPTHMSISQINAPTFFHFASSPWSQFRSLKKPPQITSFISQTASSIHYPVVLVATHNWKHILSRHIIYAYKSDQSVNTQLNEWSQGKFILYPLFKWRQNVTNPRRLLHVHPCPSALLS